MVSISKNEFSILQTVVDVLGFVIITLGLIVKSLVMAVLPRSYVRWKSVNNERVVITGGGSGLGRLLALKLAKLGATVVVWDINRQGETFFEHILQKVISEKSVRFNINLKNLLVGV